MKICPKCGAQIDDAAQFCTRCGTSFIPQGSAGSGTGYGNQAAQGYVQEYTGYSMPYDHTAEFSGQDVHDNKVFCLAIYLMGIPGIIIAMLGSKDSPYISFHVRQALKITVAEILTGLASALLFWTFILPVVGAVFLVILFVIRIICFVRICKGKAIEPPIVREISFLN